MTGYKMRRHISKSLQVRCKTIRRAVTAYNAVAREMDPPRPQVDWAKVSTYQFLEEFSLLQDTRNDLRDKRWANPGVRECLKLVRRIKRAREELGRLNVEVRRVRTAIRDENRLFTKVIRSIPQSDPLRGAVTDFATRRRRINRQTMVRVRQVYALRGFTGVKTPGIRLGSRSAPTAIPSDGDDDDDDGEDGVEDDDIDAALDDNELIDDTTRGDLNAVCETIGEMAL